MCRDTSSRLVEEAREVRHCSCYPGSNSLDCLVKPLCWMAPISTTLHDRGRFGVCSMSLRWTFCCCPKFGADAVHRSDLLCALRGPSTDYSRMVESGNDP